MATPSGGPLRRANLGIGFAALVVWVLAVPGAAHGTNNFTVGNLTINNACSNSVAVTVDNLVGAAGISFIVSYNPALIDATSAVAGSLVSGCDSFLANINHVLGTINVGIVCTAGVSGGGTVATLTFQAVADGAGTLDLNMCQVDENPCASETDGTVSVTNNTCPTATPTNTATATSTHTPTLTPTETATSTPTSTGTNTPTDTATSTPTNTPTITPTPTDTATQTATSSPTDTPTITATPTDTSTPTITPTATDTATITPTFTPTQTLTPSNTATITPTQTPTNTATITPTPSITPTVTSTPTITPTNPPTNTPTITATPSPTNTPTPMPPVITGGAIAGSTTVSGQAIPNATPGNNCITIFDCGPDGICLPTDTPIGTGSVDSSGHYVINVAPPLIAGEKIFARDTCNGLDGPPIVVSAGTAAPVMSLPMIGFLALALGVFGLLGLSRTRTRQHG
jgi:hypothetical protein